MAEKNQRGARTSTIPLNREGWSTRTPKTFGKGYVTCQSPLEGRTTRPPFDCHPVTRSDSHFSLYL